jgi:hypothetical protein
LTNSEVKNDKCSDTDGAVVEKDDLVKGRINIKSKSREVKGWMKRRIHFS